MSEMVFICHPFSNNKENLERTKMYCIDAIQRGYNPLSPALYYSLFLDDGNKEERQKGRSFGLEMLEQCSELWICGRVLTDGMITEINRAYEINKHERELYVRHME